MFCGQANNVGRCVAAVSICCVLFGRGAGVASGLWSSAAVPVISDR